MPSPAPAYQEYYPDGWADLAAGGTPLDAAALNHMEDGIAKAMPAPLSPNNQDLPIWNQSANGGSGGWDTTANLKIPKTAIQALSITDADIAPAAGIQSSKLAGSFPISKLAGYPGDSSKFLRGDGAWGSAADKASATDQLFTGSVFAGKNPAFPTTFTGAGLFANGTIRSVVSGATSALRIGLGNGTDSGDRMTIDGTGAISWLGDTSIQRSAPSVLGLTGSLQASGYVSALRTITPNRLVPYAATITPDVSSAEFFAIGLTGPVTIANPINGPSTAQTQRLVLEIYNSTAGTITPVWGSKFKGISGLGLTAGSRYSMVFYYNGVNDTWVNTGVSWASY